MGDEDKRNKQYLFDPNKEPTVYYKKKIRKLLKNEQISNMVEQSDSLGNRATEDVNVHASSSTKQELPENSSINEVIAEQSPCEIDEAGQVDSYEDKSLCDITETDQVYSYEKEIHDSQELTFPVKESSSGTDLSTQESNPDVIPQISYAQEDEIDLEELVFPVGESSFGQRNEDNCYTLGDDFNISDDDDDDTDDNLWNMIQNENKKSSIMQLQNEEHFFQTVSATVNKSAAELLLMALQFSMSCELSHSNITRLMKMINGICGQQILPETRYRLDKLLNFKENATFHAVCPACSNYLGTFNNLKKIVSCDICKMEVHVTNPSSPCNFALLDPSEAIRDCIEAQVDYYENVLNKREYTYNHIHDIYDGKMYKDFVENLDDSEVFITTVLNTDGAPVFESSNFSIWPVYLMINELPVQSRFKNIITCGLWFGSGKPVMSVFLQVFTEMMNNFATIGIPCTIKDTLYHIKVFVSVVCVDSVARPPMNGTIQFNGSYGCDWCLHSGEYYAGSIRYPLLEYSPSNRDRKSTIDYAREALAQSTAVFGVKMTSPLLNLVGFDIIEGFVPDYMHCVLAGVTEQITENILKLISKDDIEKLNNLLLQVKVPNQVNRLARPLSSRSDWKCREWENWLLYYSVPLLNETTLKKTYLKHWSLLVTAMHIALQTDITFQELNRVKELFTAFVAEVEILYSKADMTFNVHQLLHITQSIYNWGPLWAHSCFAFESANYKLLKAINAAKGVILQIIRHIQLQRFTQLLQEIVLSECSSDTNYYANTLSSRKSAFKLKTITYFGKEDSIDQFIFENIHVPKTTKVFTKMVSNGCFYATSSKINKRSCNYYAQLTDKRIIKLNHFLVDIESKKEMTVCQVIKTTQSRICSSIFNVVQISDENVIVPTTEIARICVFIETENFAYIIPLPNMYSY